MYPQETSKTLNSTDELIKKNETTNPIPRLTHGMVDTPNKSFWKGCATAGKKGK